MIIFILFGLINIINGNYLNETVIDINATSKFYNNINIPDKIEFAITSNYKIPFSLIIYTPSGNPLIYKSIHVKYKGIVTFYEIDNFMDTENQLTIKIKIQDKIMILTIWEYFFSLISLFTIVSIILTKRDSKISSRLLLILMITKLSLDYDFSNLGYIIFRKIMF